MKKINLNSEITEKEKQAFSAIKKIFSNNVDLEEITVSSQWFDTKKGKLFLDNIPEIKNGITEVELLYTTKNSKVIALESPKIHYQCLNENDELQIFTNYFSALKTNLSVIIMNATCCILKAFKNIDSYPIENYFKSESHFVDCLKTCIFLIDHVYNCICTTKNNNELSVHFEFRSNFTLDYINKYKKMECNPKFKPDNLLNFELNINNLDTFNGVTRLNSLFKIISGKYISQERFNINYYFRVHNFKFNIFSEICAGIKDLVNLKYKYKLLGDLKISSVNTAIENNKTISDNNKKIADLYNNIDQLKSQIKHLESQNAEIETELRNSKHIQEIQSKCETLNHEYVEKKKELNPYIS